MDKGWRWESDEDRGDDIWYVRKVAVEDLKEAIERQNEITQYQIDRVTDFEGMNDKEVVFGINMHEYRRYRGVCEMVASMVLKGTAEAFLEARNRFARRASAEDPSTYRAEGRSSEMSARDWLEVECERRTKSRLRMMEIGKELWKQRRR